MPNIATVLKEEIARISRKEIRKETEKLQKTSAQYRRTLAHLKRQIITIQRRLSLLENQLAKGLPEKVDKEEEKRVWFTARGLRSQRKRLGLSAENYAKLAGVSPQSIHNWEHEVSRPQRKQVLALAGLRGLGKKEAQGRLEKLKKKKKKRKRKS